MAYASYEGYLKADLSGYAGKWVALIGDKVVGADTDVKALVRRVKKEHPNKRPFISKVRNNLSLL